MSKKRKVRRIQTKPKRSRQFKVVIIIMLMLILVFSVVIIITTYSGMAEKVKINHSAEIIFTTIIDNDLQLNFDRSWLELADTEKEIELLIRKTRDSYREVKRIIGPPPIMRNINVQYNQELQASAAPIRVRFQMYENFKTGEKIPKAEEVVSYKKLILNTTSGFMIPHEITHLVVGEYCPLGMNWIEGIARMNQNLVCTKLDYENPQSFPNFDIKPFLKDCWMYDWSWIPTQHDPMNHALFELRYIIWAEIWNEYYLHYPNFFKDFHQALYNHQPPLEHEEILLIGEQVQPGFRNWYLNQSAFKKVESGRYFYLTIIDKNISAFAVTYFERQIVKRQGFFNLVIEEPVKEEIHIDIKSFAGETSSSLFLNSLPLKLHLPEEIQRLSGEKKVTVRCSIGEQSIVLGE